MLNYIVISVMRNITTALLCNLLQYRFGTAHAMHSPLTADTLKPISHNNNNSDKPHGNIIQCMIIDYLIPTVLLCF